MSSNFLVRPALRRIAQAAALAGAVLLASCGGGGQVEPFVPTRVLAFGDELSAIEADGRKYTINAFKITDATTTPPTESTTELDCARNPIWIQAVAASFGLAFDRCLGTATGASGQVLAQVGQKVADLPAQIAAVQGNPLGEKDLALVMIGMNDVLELYARYPTTDRATLLDEARARGSALGQQINQLALSGPAVVVLTVPDIGLSPFAIAENTNTGDATRSALIQDLVEVLNNRMSATLINDGRLIGLVYADTELQNNVKFPLTYGLANVVDAACLASAPLPGCTTATLVPADTTTGAAAATATTWLWADDLRLSPIGQARLGLLAASRARSNPF
jgi:lysophospholipase L1-like esterase